MKIVIGFGGPTTPGRQFPFLFEIEFVRTEINIL